MNNCCCPLESFAKRVFHVCLGRPYASNVQLRNDTVLYSVDLIATIPRHSRETYDRVGPSFWNIANKICKCSSVNARLVEGIYYTAEGVHTSYKNTNEITSESRHNEPWIRTHRGQPPPLPTPLLL